jgi:hypothetical protein
MGWWVGVIILAVVIAFAIIGQWRGWIDIGGSERSGGAGAGAFGSIDEVFHPTKHEAQQELVRQAVLPAPAPVAGDGDKGVYGGKVTIDLG